jgi:membrane protein
MRRRGGRLPLEGFAALRRAKDIVAQAALAWIEHDASTMGAALAFYTAFSVAPILIIASGVLELVSGREAVQAGLLPQMQVMFGDAGASAVQVLHLSATEMGKSRAVTLIGVATLLIGASSVFVELQKSLDRIWGVPARSRMSGLWQIVRSRFLSLGLVFGVGFLLMVSLLVSTVLTALDDWIALFLGEWRTLLLIVDLTLSLGITTVLFAFVYKYIPQAKMEWGDVWVGALVAAGLFNLGKLAIGYYMGRSAVVLIYGAAGSFLVLLLWAYYSAQIFLFGAEFTKSFSHISGTRRGMKI